MTAAPPSDAQRARAALAREKREGQCEENGRGDDRLVRIDRARFLSARELCRRYGVDSAKLAAWRAGPGFPPPIRVLNDRESYFDRWALIAWEIAMQRNRRAKAAPKGLAFHWIGGDVSVGLTTRTQVQARGPLAGFVA